jgi:hypothetical protein
MRSCLGRPSPSTIGGSRKFLRHSLDDVEYVISGGDWTVPDYNRNETQKIDLQGRVANVTLNHREAAQAFVEGHPPKW